MSLSADAPGSSRYWFTNPSTWNCRKTMRFRPESKLRKPWLTTNGFLADFAKAMETAGKDRKLVFAYFTISYDDDPDCEKVEESVLSTPEFKAFLCDVRRKGAA